MLQISAQSRPAAIEYRHHIVSKSNDLQADTSTLDICLYNEKFPTDAQYVAAAINALKKFTQKRINLQIVNNANAIPDQMDWLFWLSCRPSC